VYLPLQTHSEIQNRGDTQRSISRPEAHD